MNARSRKKRIWTAQRAWSQSSVTFGFAPAQWYSRRNPRRAGKVRLDATIGGYDVVKFVSSPRLPSTDQFGSYGWLPAGAYKVGVENLNDPWMQAAIDDIERRRQASLMVLVQAIPANADGKIKVGDIMDAVRKL